jgi:hypothetical protein
MVEVWACLRYGRQRELANSHQNDTCTNSGNRSKCMKGEASAGSEYWKVAYQIWSLKTMSQTECIRFEIPQEQLLDLNLQNQDDKSLEYTKQTRTYFRFPVAFSSSLSLLVVHGILLKIAPASVLEKMDDRGHFQVLPPPGCEHTLDMDAFTMARPLHTGRKRFSFTRGFKIAPADHKCHSWAQYFISPNEKYLIQINGSGPPLTTHTRRWIVSAYSDTQFNNWVPSFHLVASVGIQFRRSRDFYGSSVFADYCGLQACYDFALALHGER